MADKSIKKRGSIDMEKFVRGKQAGLTDAAAYRAAGGLAEAAYQAAQTYKKKPAVAKALDEALKTSATDSMLALVTLTPLAVEHYREVLQSDDPKDKRAKDKVALDVIQRTRDLLPKEIRTTHEVSVDEESQDALEAIAEFLLTDKGSSAKIIEAVESGTASRSPADDGEEEVTTEYSISSE